MNRRDFFRTTAGAIACMSLPVRANRTDAGAILLQDAWLAGFAYYDGPRLWSRLAVGDSLELVRAPRNPHDDRAVEVWRGDAMLGHVPRLDNAALAQLMDRGHPVSARITQLHESRDPWERIRFAVFLDPQAGPPRRSRRPPDERDRRRYRFSEWPRVSA